MEDRLEVDFFIARVKRINNYFEALSKSFGIMVDGMEKEQFLKFRMSLLPASGFQSAQYRMIEICTTDINNLTQKDIRDSLKGKRFPTGATLLLMEGSIEVETVKKPKC